MLRAPWGRPATGLAPALLGLLGCAAHAASRPLPSYAGHAVELFDDAIEAGAVGLDLDTPINPRTDARLRERVQVGDAAVRVRVSTVTEKAEDSGTGFVVGFQVLDQLAGAYPPSSDFSIVVRSDSPSSGILKGFQGRLMGKTFIVFVRSFVRPDGDPETHFHLAPDTKEELGAVREAAAKTAF